MRVVRQLRRGAVLVAAGLLGIGTVVLVPGAADAASGPTVRVRVSGDGTVHIKRHLRPGVHRFVVTSARDAGFQLLHPRKGYTRTEAARDVNLGLNRGNVPALRRFEANTVLLGGVASSSGRSGVLYADLVRGRVWAVDTSLSTTRASDIVTIGVHGRRVRGSLAAPTVLRAIGSTSWSRRPASIPRSGVLAFANSSSDNHFVILAKLLPGKTVADFKAWVDAAKAGGGDPGPPPVSETGGLDTGVVSPGRVMSQRYALSPGDYVLVCFWPDADMGGMPHAFMGMFRGITVR